jgi:hypothetical protein
MKVYYLGIYHNEDLRRAGSTHIFLNDHGIKITLTKNIFKQRRHKKFLRFVTKLVYNILANIAIS